ncbi:hypothetical protein B6I21_04525 [candidate division KSB1 bacterium 4572_119]|nr:MAG: hypothetical protein B6I21_04525 [candidate division KSB1 bacterium 4572_119]
MELIKNSPQKLELGIIPFDLFNQKWGLIGGSLSRQFFNLVGTAGTIIFFPTIVFVTSIFAFDIKYGKVKMKLERLIKIAFALITFKYDRRMFKKSKPLPEFKEILASGKKKEKEAKKTPAIKIGSREPQPASQPDTKLEKKKSRAEKKRFFSDKHAERTAEPASKEKEDEQPLKANVGKVYTFPDPSLLDDPPATEEEVSWDELMTSAKTLEDKLADFGIEGKVVEINPGPVITRFEIEPAPGVKISRFTSLSDDLAMVMRAKRIRVVAPIPGKAAIGIEIPNRKQSTVFLKSVIDSAHFRANESPLTMAFGKTIAGDIFVADLESMPHLLIAGATGSGKSVCLNTIIASMLFKASPDQIQFVMIDPKRLELSVYSALKYHHLTFRDDIGEEVVTNPASAVSILRSMELEMERRYELLAKAGVRNIIDYNNWLKTAEHENPEDENKFQPLKYLVLIIDELADLMLIAAREVEEPIARLTQMSRAVGIHLIVATQRPSVDVITGVIKANFPARIAFQVASKTDSRTILDMNGAEKLLGKGDMLFLPPASPEPIRIHTAYISHEEVKHIIENIRQQPIQDPKFLLPTENDDIASRSARFSKDDQDELFNEALKLVVRHQQGSVSLLQRRLKVGYARAARMIDQLEDAGYVGPFDGSKAREVLIDEEELMDLGLF